MPNLSRLGIFILLASASSLAACAATSSSSDEEGSTFSSSGPKRAVADDDHHDDMNEPSMCVSMPTQTKDATSNPRSIIPVSDGATLSDADRAKFVGFPHAVPVLLFHQI